MPYSTTTLSQKSSSTGICVLLLLAIFSTELAIMELFAPLFSRLTPIAAGLIDAAVLSLIYASPLWFFAVQPLYDTNSARGTELRPARAALFTMVLTVIFLDELLVMLSLSHFMPHLDILYIGLVDASLNILTCAPLLWWLLFRLGGRKLSAPLADLLGTPLKLFVLLLFMVFMVDLLQDLLFPLIVPDASIAINKLAEAFLTTLFAAPFLWWFVARPLKTASVAEKTRADALGAQVVDAIVTFDAKGIVEALNPAAERIFGYPTAELTGTSAEQLFVDGRQSLAELIRTATADGAEDMPATGEVVGRHRNGSTLTMEVSISKVSLGGRQHFLMILRDITTRRKAEEAIRESDTRIRQVFEQTEDAIIFFKPGTCSIIDLNSTTEKLFGFTKSELKAGGLKLLCRPEDLARLGNVIRTVRRDEMSQLDRIVNLRNDGTEVVTSMRGKVMTLQGVDIVYCTFRDATDRIRMEEEAREIQSKLIQANKMTSLGLLVSGVAHEINNPNNFIMANSQLMATMWDDALKVLRDYYRENGEFYVGGIPFSEMDAQSPQLFAGIVDGTRRINEIVNNLKRFARQDQIVTERDVDVNQVVTTAVSILHHELIKYTENFHLDLEGDLPCVQGSNQQLAQVVINLMMNACQALPTKHHGIWVTTGFDAETGQVVLTVRDEGSGITRDVSDRILEPFFTTKLDYGGTGLGLSISQSIIKEHNGSLEFFSEPGKGTTFVVKIPAVIPATKEHS